MEAFAKILKDFQRWTTAEKLHLRSDSISRSAFGTPWKKTKKRRKFSVKLKVCNFIKTRNFSKMFKDFAATFGTLDFTGKRLCRNQWRVKWNSQAACYLIRKIINIFLRASEWLLVCVCVFVFISFHRRGFSWLKQNNKCNARDQAYVVLRKLLCVKYLHRHVIDNHSRDLQASNCARVSIKQGGATRNKRKLLELSENQQ